MVNEARPESPEVTMSNDKKPKKAKAPIVHGSSNRGREVTMKLMEPTKPSPLAPAKKKK